jgi:Fe2+ transport system protein FeoA
MNIKDLKIGDKATIISINTDHLLKLRLQSLGIHRGVTFEVREFALAKQNVSIAIDDNLIGLRKYEMESIEVELQD